MRNTNKRKYIYILFRDLSFCLKNFKNVVLGDRILPYNIVELLMLP